MCYTLEEIREKAIPIAKYHGVKRLYLFGSYARGEATDESDVDFYIEEGRVTSLLRYFALVNDLEKSFQCHVDVVSMGIEDRNFLENIRQEGVMLYEAVGS